jgi:hypothetical protein
VSLTRILTGNDSTELEAVPELEAQGLEKFEKSWDELSVTVQDEISKAISA